MANRRAIVKRRKARLEASPTLVPTGAIAAVDGPGPDVADPARHGGPGRE